MGDASLPLPPEVLPDLLCLAEFFSVFHEQLAIPKLSVEDLANIVSSPKRLELAESVCCTMTKHIVQLSQVSTSHPPHPILTFSSSSSPHHPHLLLIILTSSSSSSPYLHRILITHSHQ